ncbi:metal ABC transporter substrate-binding protein [Geobacter hydrogenophilus]|uniref:Periplasmic divalent manganese/zinc-binding lipoprotein n=1 Tax=Geobacter hydrogenophilus TaxID=40983 RepID=A0A9W6G160_9BACT|nr:metal ABC transporter substrate-binding protein [Geobacter hydrogenophilus]MBT0894188.1 metal ABC transporter substrate-binding protein [Geobacter hydrogenophilus]GLI38529.1 periplasmic divalent manganese/zinc-binding lipoprotein [Geobacter hydrogenophilus]
MRRIAMMVLMLVLATIASGCRKTEELGTGRSGKLRVVATIFPVYDFARAVAGDKAEVTLLLPPGMEPHSFEPQPADIVRVSRADLFIYTNRYMEPWAGEIVKGAGGGKLTVVDASRGAKFLKVGEGEDRDSHGAGGHNHGGEGMDPHLWLDFTNAQLMVDTIAAALAERDPTNRAVYLANAAAYRAKLADLDERYRKGLATCATRTILHGGHYAFGYLANRYGLRYLSAYAVSADAEPTPARLAKLVKQVRAEGLKYIFTEELLDPRTAETIARETGASILMLHGAHTVSKADLDKGTSFISLMEKNLANLREGLQCR